ncbi:F-box protein At4g09920-like [Silene latifolia]|uniref:F-box protein At4g09920-like n=1 Tax=Silene latifolia TaxID=37657 RepID=UPI003D776C90
MSSSRERGKYVVYTRRRCLDRISSLPDELLAHVLSFLPTRCAVSTSVLSTRWRHLFTLSTSLCFDDTPCFDGGPYFPGSIRRREIKKIDAGQKRRFRKFVEKVLELHQIVPIKKFSLVCQGDYDKSDINAWVSFAVRKGVEDLHYQVNVQEDHEPPDDIFECETLVRLKMIGLGEYILEIPLSACFPRLKILHLDDVSIFEYDDDDDSVERLFSGCELLEELTLKKCKCDTHRHVMLSTRVLKILRVESCSFEKGVFEIDAPNLTHLTHKFNSGIKIVPSWKDSCSLAEAELYFCYDTEDDNYEGALRYDFEVLKAAAHKVTELHLTVRKVNAVTREGPEIPKTKGLLLLLGSTETSLEVLALACEDISDDATGKLGDGTTVL